MKKEYDDVFLFFDMKYSFSKGITCRTVKLSSSEIDDVEMQLRLENDFVILKSIDVLHVSTVRDYQFVQFERFVQRSPSSCTVRYRTVPINLLKIHSISQCFQSVLSRKQKFRNILKIKLHRSETTIVSQTVFTEETKRSILPHCICQKKVSRASQY